MATHNWNYKQIEELIELFHDEPCLWNKMLPTYSDIDQRRAAQRRWFLRNLTVSSWAAGAIG